MHRPAVDVRAGRFIGLDRSQPGRDLLRGVGLAALIGLPGLAFYFFAKAIGINTQVSAANLEAVWWSGPVLVLAAIENAVLEEVIMVGYLFTRWRQIGWSWPLVIGLSAVIRGSYHLYQGFGGFAGNIVMGLVLGPRLRAHAAGHAARRLPLDPRHRRLRRLLGAAGARRLASDGPVATCATGRRPAPTVSPRGRPTQPHCIHSRP